MWDTIFQTILQIGIVLPALGFMIWALVRERRDPRWRIWLILTTIAAVMLAVYTTQGGIEYRDAPYLEMIALIPYAELSYRIIRQIGKRFAGLQRSVIRPFATALLISWYVFPAFTANAVADEEGPKVSGRTACPVKSAAPVLRKLNDPARLQTIMAFVDFGPELMYRTPHAVLSIPNHHAQPGYRQTWDAMTAPGPEAAKPLIAGQGVDFVLVCDNKIPDGFYGQLGAVDTFRHALIAGRAPAWLTPVSLPETADGFRLYRVVPESDPER